METWQKRLIEIEANTTPLSVLTQEGAMKNFIASLKRETEQKTTLSVNLAAIKSLMKTMKLSPSEAMTAMEIPVAQQSIYAAQL